MLTALTVIVFLINLCASATAGWYDDPRQGRVGWYGYQKYENKKEQEKEAKKEESRQERIETTKWPTYEEALKMKPSELKKWLQRAAEEAVANPTEKNVLRWATYMKATREKSLAFAGAVAWVLQNHPELTYNQYFPIVFPAKRALLVEKTKEIEGRLRQESEDFALILFVSKDAPYTKGAMSICKYFAQKYGWRVEIVDADENPLLARAMGVTYIPQAWVISRKGYKPFLAMTGIVSLKDLERAIYKGIKIVKGEMSPEEYGKPIAKGLVNYSVRKKGEAMHSNEFP